jgi:hypothetical protein
MEMLACMEKTQPRDQAELARSLDQLGSTIRRGEIVVLLSDFWEDLEPLTRGAMQILHKGAELIVFHVLHNDELQLPYWSETLLIEAETGQRLQVNVDDLRDEYQRRLQQHLEAVRTRFQRLGIQYQFAPMTETYWQTLERYLVRRCSH